MNKPATKETKCPSCRVTLLPDPELLGLRTTVDVLKHQLDAKAKRLRELEATRDMLNEQEEAKRAELNQRMIRAEAETVEARKEAAAATAKLKRFHAVMTDYFDQLEKEATPGSEPKALGFAAALGQVETPASDPYEGQHDWDGNQR